MRVCACVCVGGGRGVCDTPLEKRSPSEGNFKPLGDKAFSTIVHGRLVQGSYAWLGTRFPRQY